MFLFVTVKKMTGLGYILRILKATELLTTSTAPNPPSNNTAPSFLNSTPVTPPHVVSEITHPQFRKFKINWEFFKQIRVIPPPQIAVQLYNLCDDSIQNTFANTITDVFQLSENNLLKVRICS